MQEHEYALLGGINRSLVGRYLSLIAAGVSAGIVFLLLTCVDLAKHYNLPVNLPPIILSLAGASSVFTAIYWLFNRYGWRLRAAGILLKVPNLSGKWEVVGQTLNPDKTPGYVWNGTITITQTWDKLRVHLATNTSTSDSISAALVRDDIEGFRLLYHYRNNPNIESVDLANHYGFAELIFNNESTDAAGEYFNGRGRFTFGTMKLKRI